MTLQFAPLKGLKGYFYQLRHQRYAFIGVIRRIKIATANIIDIEIDDEEFEL